jgi:hypothetical protein
VHEDLAGERPWALDRLDADRLAGALKHRGAHARAAHPPAPLLERALMISSIAERGA